MFEVLYHSDWSTDPRKRWTATALREGERWIVHGPRQVGSSDEFLERLFGTGGRVLAGFDFPIGLPAAYGRLTPFESFREALTAFGAHPGWHDFFSVAEQPEQISVFSPFYPRHSTKGVQRASLVEGLGMASFRDLLRECERGGPGRREACSLFWTLGGNQVGRAAISGWQEVVRPVVARGGRLWPFDGSLAHLAAPGLTIAETYPADAYALLGAPFGPGESKRRSADRASKASPISRWAEHARVDLGGAARALAEGFGPRSAGEDPFDALVGLLAMIEVVDRRRPEMSFSASPQVEQWEGWILGR